MNWKKYALSVLAAFVFVFFYEWLVHGVLLMSTYETTPALWRTQSEMKAHMPIMMFFQFALAAWSGFAFAKFYPEGGIKNGLLFGILLGVFAGILVSSWYVWLPISKDLSWSWFTSSVLEGIGMGGILGFFYRR